MKRLSMKQRHRQIRTQKRQARRVQKRNRWVEFGSKAFRRAKDIFSIGYSKDPARRYPYSAKFVISALTGVRIVKMRLGNGPATPSEHAIKRLARRDSAATKQISRTLPTLKEAKRKYSLAVRGAKGA